MLELAKTAPTTPSPTPEKAWRSTRDWVNAVFGLYLMLAPSWTAGAVVGWFIVMGALVVLIALWALATASSLEAEWTQVVAGALTILTPWFGRFDGAAQATATACFVGVAVFGTAALSIANSRGGKT